MRGNQQRRRLRTAIFIFWLLFMYIIAALIWWYITLERQNNDIARIKNENNPPAVAEWEQKAAARRSIKYAGEGSAFLIVILIGAIYVFRSVRKQLRLNRQQQDFIMAVTHELKTPLAIGRLNIETMQKRKLSEEQQQKLLQSTLVEMQRLNDLTTNILVVSRLDAGEYKHEDEAIHLSALVASAVNDFQKQHPDQPVSASIEQDIFVNGDSLLLKLVVSNLLGNAIKYSGGGKPIVISLSGKEQVTLTVADTGPGIPESEKQNIFEKFYRVQNESTRNTQGTGLGLYLCKKILQDHKAAIRVSDNVPTGSLFTVTFRKNA